MKQIITYKVAILWALFILGACGINGNSLPQVSFDIGIDKIAHMLFFAILSILVWWPTKNNLLWAIVISTAYGILIEYLQMTVFINRSFDYADMLADAVGAILCYPISKLVKKGA